MAEMKARIVLDSSGYSSGVSKVISDTDNMINATNKAKQAINAMKTNVSMMITAKDSATESISRIKSKVELLVKANYKFEIAAIDKTVSVISKIRDSIFNLKTLAAGIVLGSAGKMGYDWTIGNAINNENYLATLQTVLHDKNKGTQALKWAYQDAASTPFDAGQVVAGVTQLATSGLDYTKYLNPLGDAAAAMNRPLEQAMAAMAKLKSGQYGIAVDMFRDFGVSNTDWTKAGATFKKNGEMIMDNPQKAVDMVTKIIQSKYGGLMEQKSATAGGMLSNIGDSIQSMGRGLAGIDSNGGIMKGGLFDNFKQQLQVIMPLLNKIQGSNAFKELQKDIGNLATAGGQKLTTFLKSFDDPKKVKEYEKTFKDFINDIKAGANTALLFAKAINNIATVLEPLIKLIAAHPNLFVGLFAGYEAFKAGSLIINVLKNIGAELPNIISAFKLFSSGAIGCFKTVLLFMLANPLPILAIIAVVALLYEAWKHDWGGIREKTTEVVDYVIGRWNELKEILAHPIDAIINMKTNDNGTGLGVDSKVGMGTVSNTTTRMGGHNNALGTNYWKGGLTYVNEGNNGELINLPSGTQILNHRDTKKALDGKGDVKVFVTIQGNVIGNEQFADEVGEHVTKKYLAALNNM